MDAESFELLHRLEPAYWWFAGMRRITDAILHKELSGPGIRILDAGCGTGFNMHYYGSCSSRMVFGLDVAEGAIHYIRNGTVTNFTQASVTAIPFRSETFDLVFSFEVVTQLRYELQDDALREMRRVLKPEGSLFIRVPAFKWLWSSHDQAICAFYRYTRRELEDKLRRLGYRIEWISYANTFLFPVALLRRMLKRFGIAQGSDVRPFPHGMRWLNRVFRCMLESEATWFQHGHRFPFGLSIVCHAKRS